MAELDFLDSTHPVFDEWTRGAPIAAKQTTIETRGDSTDPRGELVRMTLYEQMQSMSALAQGWSWGAWLRNEIRLRGGDEVLAELRRFEWEIAGGEKYRSRQSQATYINFPDMFARLMVGHLFRQAPQPGHGLSFGSLGEPTIGESSRPQVPPRADDVWWNVDGVGRDGSQWDNFWQAALLRAFATGHRWIFVEASSEAPRSRQDELQGLRPYLVEYSPTAVPDWHYDRGRLEFAIVRPRSRRPVVRNGTMEGSAYAQGYLLLVRNGFDGLGSRWQGGGWWLFDDEKKFVASGGNDPQAGGGWEKLDGQIPLFPLFYERDEGSSLRPAMSRPGMKELGQVAVSYMNLSSAADFDAWDAASSVQYLAGVDVEGFNLATAKYAAGNRQVPLPPHQDTGQVPQVFDGSTGAVTAEVFKSRLDSKREEAKEIASREISSSPESSGISKMAGFAEGKSPRLALLAAEIEQAQNTAIHFLEARYGEQPSGAVSWERDFELLPLRTEIREYFDLVRSSGIRNADVEGRAMALAAREHRLADPETDLEAMIAAFVTAAREARDREAQIGSLLGG